MILVVGLGNPGSKYSRNRHNVGFMIVDRIAAHYGFSAWRRRFHAMICEGQIADRKCMLLKPETYMNSSGQAVGEAARFYKISTDNIIVIHDELDLEPGKIRVKTGGGNAGHNGLRSISSHVGNDYVRLRVGIGHPGRKELVHSYVLHDFTGTDRQWLKPLVEAITAALPFLWEKNAAGFSSEVARLQNYHEQ
jgi:PTH1 family peptidyl-tRNA hydrolase